MLTKFNNITPYKSISFNDKTIYNRLIKDTNNKDNIIDVSNQKTPLQKEILNSKFQKINNNFSNKKNKNSFSTRSRHYTSKTPRNENKNSLNETKIKTNNVTNNICIIIKTSDNKEQEKKNAFDFGYYDLFKRIYQNRSISNNNSQMKNNKSNRTFIQKTRNNSRKKIYSQLLINLNKKINTKLNEMNYNIKKNTNSNEYKSKNKNVLALNIQNNKIKNLQCSNSMFDSLDKTNTLNSNCLYNNDISGIFTQTNGSLISSSIKKNRNKNFFQL